MSFLDSVVTTTKNAASAAGKKTDSAIRISKLKFKRASLGDELEKKYEKLGQFVYDAAKSGEKDTEQFDSYIADIDVIKAELEGIEKQLDELRGKVACESCGFKTEMENAFCPKCGAKLPEKPAPEEVIDEVDADFEEAPAFEEDKFDEDKF